MKKTGRPTAFKPEYVAQAQKLCELGATDTDLANFFEVGTRSIARWQVEFPEFRHALKDGKANADDRVERSLYHRANGYTHEAVKIFMPAGAAKPIHAKYIEHVPPDITACIFWLKNRRPDLWRDKRDIDHNLKGFDGLSLEQRRALDAAISTLPGDPEETAGREPQTHH